MHTTISVILPVYNESETLDILKARLTPVLEESVGGSFEVLFVDDGSHDGTDKIIDGFHERDPRFKAIHFSRNFGHQAALQAGLDAALGDAVALMDADLQDPPELLGQFIKHCRLRGAKETERGDLEARRLQRVLPHDESHLGD
jgi:glycosyltransferase involved in cell wall biosynthesis